MTAETAGKFVALPILADPTTGGWITFTAHLAYGLKEAGYEPILFKVAKKSEKSPRDFGRGLEYWNITFEDLVNLAKTMPTIVTALGASKREYAAGILGTGAALVIHDPTELSKDVVPLLSGNRIITIRKAVSAKLKAEGIENTLIPHPYLRSPEKRPQKANYAVAYSRVDWDKGTHIIAEANNLLPENKQIQIHGTLNRFYAFTKLDKADPEWKRNYHGGWSAKESLWFGVSLAAASEVSVDLSSISGDGGGTQYSFLEAFDAGTPLVINKKWITGDPELDEIVPAIAGSVSTAEELVDLFSKPFYYNKVAAENILQAHDAGKVATELLKGLL